MANLEPLFVVQQKLSGESAGSVSALPVTLANVVKFEAPKWSQDIEQIKEKLVHWPRRFLFCIGAASRPGNDPLELR